MASFALSLGACQKGSKTSDGAEKTGKSRLGDVEIAKVGGTLIYRSDVERLALERGLLKSGETLSETNPAFQSLLEELIDQRVLSQAAIRRALDKTPENKRRLATARERILGNILVEAHLKETVNEKSIRRMYDQQAELTNRGDEVQARQILLSDEASAKAAEKALADGQGFAELARSVSTDAATREKGGDLGWFTRDMLNLDFTRIVFGTPVGERTKPFKTSAGWHIVEVQNRRGSPQQSFEELKPNIVKFMTFDAIQSLIQDLRRKSEIETFYDLESKKAVPASDGTDEGGPPDTETKNKTETEKETDPEDG